MSDKSFVVSYNAGGVLDKVKGVKSVETINNLENVEEIENIQNVNLVKGVDNVAEVGKIKGFATKTQPYNFMKMFDIKAQTGDYEFEIAMPEMDCEILAISLTCSGYGEDDNYDLYFNGVCWFDKWYCSEVKEGLFLGTSTYVYDAPGNSLMKLVFHNDSGTQKKIWLGVRTLIDKL